MKTKNQICAKCGKGILEHSAFYDDHKFVENQDTKNYEEELCPKCGKNVNMMPMCVCGYDLLIPGVKE